MKSHKSWLFPLMGIVGAMLLAGGALLYLNPDYLNAATLSGDESLENTLAEVTTADVSTCSGNSSECYAAGDCSDGDGYASGYENGVVCDRVEASRLIAGCAASDCSG